MPLKKPFVKTETYKSTYVRMHSQPVVKGYTVRTIEGGLESAGIKLLDGVTLVCTPAEMNARWSQHCKFCSIRIV
jgi:hypothetical protein